MSEASRAYADAQNYLKIREDRSACDVERAALMQLAMRECAAAKLSTPRRSTLDMVFVFSTPGGEVRIGAPVQTPPHVAIVFGERRDDFEYVPLGSVAAALIARGVEVRP